MMTAGGLEFVAENVGPFTEGIPNPVPAVLYAFDAKTGKAALELDEQRGQRDQRTSR